MIHLNGIDDFTIITTHKSVQPSRHQSTSSDGGCEWCAYPIWTEHKPWIYNGAQNLSSRKKEIYKETERIEILVSNVKDIIYQFLSVDNKYGLGCLASMVGTATGANKVFRLVEQI